MFRTKVVLLFTWLLSLCCLSQAQQPRMGMVLCQLQDHEGCWWYGTQGGGLLRDDGREVEVFRSDRNCPDLLGSNDVTCLAECTLNDEIWFGTKRGAYILAKPTREIRPLLSDELADMRLNSMLQSHRGTMWVAYRNHLLEVSAEADTVLRRFELTWRGKNRGVVALAEDRSGTLWLSLWNAGICRLQRGQNTIEACPWDRDDYCTELRFDSLRNCITAITSTDDHLMVRRSDGTAVPDIDMSATLHAALLRHAQRGDSTVLAYVEAPDSSYYIGTYHSLYHFFLSTDSLLHLRLDTEKVRDLCLAADGTVYLLSKPQGVCRLLGDSVEVLLSDDRFRSLELRGDTLLWLTDGVGNACTFDLRTQELIEQSPPVEPERNHMWLWLLLATVVLISSIGVAIWYKRKQRVQEVGRNSIPSLPSSTSVPDVSDASDPPLSASDQEFLEHATAIVQTHLAEPDYAVDAMASDLCMSRTNLYRRMRQVSGVSPTDFIRNQRLDRAAKLLRTTSSSVNEVADLVGFAYASYFTRCFKERFGVAPKDYR